jgi:RNA recognition motif-containing protein
VGKKLHVGNLTHSATSSDLQGWFAPFGTVQSAQVISDRDTGRSKGFGFVEMDSDAQAQAAIQGLHDQDHDGRHLTVDEAKPRVARTMGFAGGSIDGSGRTGGGGGGYAGGGRQY